MLSRVSTVPASGDPAAPAHVALRDGIRRFVGRRVPRDQVDDLVQDVLLRMHERAADLRDGERVAGWAFRIARSVVVDHKRRERPTEALVEEPPAPDDDGNDNINAIAARWLRPMLPLLPAEYADALEQVELRGLSQREYAAQAGLSISGAKSRVQRARAMLEGVVRACCDIELDARGNVIGYVRKRDGVGCGNKTCK
jgi:RNA polymerase sigma-70 factor, ECF subfamily